LLCRGTYVFPSRHYSPLKNCRIYYRTIRQWIKRPSRSGGTIKVTIRPWLNPFLTSWLGNVIEKLHAPRRKDKKIQTKRDLIFATSFTINSEKRCSHCNWYKVLTYIMIQLRMARSWVWLQSMECVTKLEINYSLV